MNIQIKSMKENHKLLLTKMIFVFTKKKKKGKILGKNTKYYKTT